MSEGKLTFVYRHHPQPGREYYVQELGTGICCQHEDPALALKQFDSIWAGRSPYQLREEAPPQPRRFDSPKTVNAAIEGDSLAVVFHRNLVKEFHSDRVGHRTLSSDDVLSVINRLWQEATAK